MPEEYYARCLKCGGEWFRCPCESTIVDQFADVPLWERVAREKPEQEIPDATS